MERFVPLCRLNVVLALAMAMVMGAPAYAQITTPCNASVINNSLGPCMGFLTNSSGNGTSPTAECCSSIKSLTSGGMDCLCLIVTATIPFRIPINRTLAISLPRACKLPGVPLQCKGMFLQPLFLLSLFLKWKNNFFVICFILFYLSMRVRCVSFCLCYFSATGSPLPAPGTCKQYANPPKNYCEV